MYLNNFNAPLQNIGYASSNTVQDNYAWSMDDDFEESTHGMLEGTILALDWRVFNQDSTYSGVDPKR